MTCTECRPRIFDRQTNELLPDDHPVMSAILKCWDTAPEGLRQAYHRVHCEGSMSKIDQEIYDRMVFVMKAAGGTADQQLRAKTEKN